MTNTYNYLQAVKEDVLNEIASNSYGWTPANMSDFEEKLNEDLFIDDAVTGNGSGSYTFSTWKAEENLCHNLELIEETAEYFGVDPVISADYKHGAEFWDVSIRCYLLPQAISEVLEENKEQILKQYNIEEN